MLGTKRSPRTKIRERDNIWLSDQLNKDHERDDSVIIVATRERDVSVSIVNDEEPEKEMFWFRTDYTIDLVIGAKEGTKPIRYSSWQHEHTNAKEIGMMYQYWRYFLVLHTSLLARHGIYVHEKSAICVFLCQ